MAGVEETLARIGGLGGVDGYVIVDKSGVIIRQSKSLSSEDAAVYATEMSALASKARHVVRDLNPKTDLDIFRLRGREREILTAPGPDDAFLVIVIQKWTSAPPDTSALASTLPAGGAMAAVAAISGK